MTDKPAEENDYRWTPQAFEQAKLEARQMDIGRLAKFIEDSMRRCERDDQALGAMVLATVAASVAALKLRKSKPSAYQLSLAALMVYRELMGIPGPFRLIAYEQMLRPNTTQHFEAVVDWQAAEWLVQEAQARLLAPGLDPTLKKWLTKIALGQLPYGWIPERALLPDGFKRRQ